MNLEVVSTVNVFFDIDWNYTVIQKNVIPARLTMGYGYDLVNDLSKCDLLVTTRYFLINPPFSLRIKYANGEPYKNEECVELSVVSENNTLLNPKKCNCNGKPFIESKKRLVRLRDGEGQQLLKFLVRDGQGEFFIGIGCLTSSRYHDEPFRIKLEFTGENSPLKGKAVYSKRILVLSKSFSNKTLEGNQNKNVLLKQLEQRHVEEQKEKKRKIEQSNSNITNVNELIYGVEDELIVERVKNLIKFKEIYHRVTPEDLELPNILTQRLKRIDNFIKESKEQNEKMNQEIDSFLQKEDINLNFFASP